ncbi:MAG: YceI family protein [Schleiferiaceae bacterium]
MKKLFTLLALTLGLSLSAQQYMTRQGSLTFDAGSPLEDIVATSNSATAVYDVQDGKLGVQVLMTSFEFKRALMQEHFNENYAESEVYPKAVFKGKFEAGRAIGALTIHGVTKDVDVPAKLDLSKETAHLVAEFAVTIEEYGIAIPSAVANKIDKQAKIIVDCKMQSR